MSHAFDRESHFAPARTFTFSTSGVPASERLDYWRTKTSGRLVCTTAPGKTNEMGVRVRGLIGDGVEFLDYQSNGLWMDRTARMCRNDGRDEISIGLVLSPRSGADQEGCELRLQQGDLYVIDFGRPVKSTMLNHHELAITLPRRRVADAVGCDPLALGGRHLPRTGIGTVLATHMRTVAGELERLTIAEKSMMTRITGELALATLRAVVRAEVRPEQMPPGLRTTALELIRQHCADPVFSAERLAALLGCSRTTLYRLFAGWPGSLSGAIREARLERAHALLSTRGPHGCAVGEVAFRCGFLDHATFSRQFKARYGLSPRELMTR